MIFKTESGLIDISPNVFAKIAGYATSNCFGVKKICPPSVLENFAALGKARKGVQVLCKEDSVDIELRIAMVNGVNMQEVCRSIRSEVSYLVEKYTGVKVSDVRIFVDSVATH